MRTTKYKETYCTFIHLYVCVCEPIYMFMHVDTYDN